MGHVKSENFLRWKIKDAFFANVGGELRSDIENEAFERWLDSKDYTHEELLDFYDNPGYAEHLFKEECWIPEPKQLVFCEQSVEKLRKIIDEFMVG